jgi:YfiR/HmsC-like
MQNKIKIISIAIIGFFLLGHATLNAQSKAAPAKAAAALVVKLASFEKKVSGSGDVTIYVMGAPNVAAEIKKAIGKKMGGASLKSVEEGAGLPGSVPNILYIGGAAEVQAGITYTQKEKILSVSGLPDLASKGVTLTFGIKSDGKPEVTLNLTSSKEEDLNWNPAIMKIAKTIK